MAKTRKHLPGKNLHDKHTRGKTPQFRSIFPQVRKLRKILFYHNSAAKFYFPIVPQQKNHFTTIPQQIFFIFPLFRSKIFIFLQFRSKSHG
jgi:hypothetical protein